MPDERTLSDLLADLSESDDPQGFVEEAKAAFPHLADDLDRHIDLLRLVDDAVRDEVSGTGMSVGPYRVLEFVARGGMGVVYLAEQTEPIRRRVALKILSQHMDTPEARARFDLEREALSRMEHPNIARVFDAGPMPDGRPYVVMEFVDGPPLTEYCLQRDLGLDDRLALFVAVCDAVSYAHQKGVIHRDVKPSNVLVAEVDGRPVPKVIDFGLAKPLSDADARPEVTMRGQVLGTPAYMSPEQAVGDRDVDIRTDVYGLGVLLYELLVGDVPWGRETFSRIGVAAFIRRILEEDPPRPSTRLSSITSARPVTAIDTGHSHPTWARRLRGDLDWITMRALEKEPGRRYGSARELADDIRRHLRHEPVEAGPPSASYRARKFLQRHGVAVSAGALVLAALAAGLVVSLAQRAEAVDAQEVAVAERQRAEDAEREARSAADRAAAVKDYLLRIIAAPDPQEGGQDVRVRDFLAGALADLKLDEEEDPLVAAELHDAVAATYLAINQPDEAETHARKAVALRSGALGEHHPDTLAARVQVALAPGLRGDLDELEKRCTALLPLLEQYRDPDDAYTQQVRYHLAHVLLSRGETVEAVPLLQGILDAEGGLPAGEKLAVAKRLADALHSQGDHGGAHALLEERVTRLAEERGANDALSLKARLYAAHDEASQGDPERAIARLRVIVQDARSALGTTHPVSIRAATVLAFTLTKDARSMPDHREAETLARQAVDAAGKLYGLHHPKTIEPMRALARAQTRQERFEEAAQTWGRILTLLQEAGVTEMDDIRVDAETRLAELLLHGGGRARAEVLLRGLVARVPRPVLQLRLLAELLVDTGRAEEAERLLARAVRAEADVHGEDSIQVANCEFDRAECLHSLGRLEESLALFERSLAMIRRVRGPEDVTYHRKVSHLLDLYQKMGKRDELRQLAGEVIPVLEAMATTYPDDPGPLNSHADIQTHLAGAAEADGDAETCLEHWARACELYERAVERAPGNWVLARDAASAHNKLARRLEDAGKNEVALAHHHLSAVRMLDAAAQGGNADPCRWQAVLLARRAGALALRIEKPERALEELRLAREALDALFATHDAARQWADEYENWHEEEANVAFHTTSALLALKQFEKAVPVAQQLCELRRRIAKRSPSVNNRGNLSVVLLRLADVLVGAERLEAAYDAQTEALAVLEAMAAELPDGERVRDDLRKGHVVAANMLETSKRPEGVRGHLEQALAATRWLLDRHPDAEVLVAQRTSLEERLAALGAPAGDSAD